MTTPSVVAFNECLDALREIRGALSTVTAKLEQIIKDETTRGEKDCTHPDAVDASAGGGGPRTGYCPDCATSFEVKRPDAGREERP